MPDALELTGSSLTSCRVGADPERRLTIRWWLIDVHGVLIFPLAAVFGICRTEEMRRFRLPLSLGAPTMTRATVFLCQQNRVGWLSGQDSGRFVQALPQG